MFLLKRHEGTIIAGIYYYTIIDTVKNIESGMVFGRDLLHRFKSPSYPHKWYNRAGLTHIAEAESLDELKLKVSYLFL